jgi:phosphoribosylformylglycinamidine (FGAM) synthase PurS component
MKKIVIAMLLMLPLIIVATVLVSVNIISVNVYIAVESVELNVADDMLTMPLDTEQFQFDATVYPTAARSQEVYWEIENYECFGDDVDEAVTIDQTGLVKFSTYCAFDVVVTTEEGYKTDRCNVIIESGDVQSVTMICDNYSISTGDSMLIDPTFNPIDGQVDNMTWESSDTSVISVDKNGIITGKSVGTADITVRISDTITDTKTFTVEKGVTKYGTEFTTSRDFALSEIDPAGSVTVESGGYFEGLNFIFTDNQAVLNVGNVPVAITKCATDDIEIENYDILSNQTIRLGNVPIYLNAVYSDVFRTDKPVASYSTNNELIATIDSNGEINGIGRGEVKFVATATNSSASIFLEAIQEIKYLRLDTTDSDDKKGIADTAVYGNEVYSNGNFVSYNLVLGIMYPENATWEDFDISISDETLASIDGHTIVFDGNIVGTQTLVITVTAKHSAYKSMDVTSRRTLTITNAVNCSDYDSMYQSAISGKSICMLNNVVSSSTDLPLILEGSLYGNGYMLDDTLMEKEFSTEMVKVNADNVTISNILIRCDDPAKINESNGLSGYAISIGQIEQSERFTNITIEYSIMEDCYYGLSLHNTDLVLNGCIIRNTSNFGIYLPSDYNSLREDGCDYSNLHMNNCVMSNIVATAIGVATNADLEIQSNLYSTGFLDIYNWQDVTSARMLDRTIIKDNEAFDATIKNILNNALANEVIKDQYDSIRETIDGTNYIHLGIITAGAMYENTSIIDIEDDRFIVFPLEVLNDLSDNALIRLFLEDGLYPCTLYVYDINADITAESEFSENKWTYKRLRGEESI